MKKIIILVTTLVSILLLSSCATNKSIPGTAAAATGPSIEVKHDLKGESTK